MKSILKFKIPPPPSVFANCTTIQLPQGAEILHVDVMNDQMFLWALVDKDSTLPTQPVTIAAYATGEPIQDLVGYNQKYLETVKFHRPSQSIDYVVHLFLLTDK